MIDNNLRGFFETFLDKGSLFVDKKVLQSTHIPNNILHRDEQIQTIANILAPVLRLERPSNLFIYGKTGTGKTLSVKHVATQLDELGQQKSLPIRILYLNCKLKRIADTEYRIIAQLAREFGKAIPPTGLPTDEVYKIFFSAVDTQSRMVVLILDEIDQLVKKAGDEIIYNFTRINDELKNSQICLVGISNDLMFTDSIDPRIKSSLSEEEILFPPYNAIQIQQILRNRSKSAFKDEVLEQGVIEKCAAYAARDHGDARRALELLRVAGELAERSSSEIINMTHIDQAEDKIERDRVVDIVSSQPKQHQLLLYSVLTLGSRSKGKLSTGEIYEVYKRMCPDTGLRPLTLRRISDVLAELDMLGILHATVISKGRYGRTKEIEVALPSSSKPKVLKLLKEEMNL